MNAQSTGALVCQAPRLRRRAPLRRRPRASAANPGKPAGRALRRVRGSPDDAGVPRISEFYGIVIAMYYREHGVPHFHASYAGETVVMSILSGDVIAGRISARALRLVREWCELHRDELRLNWARARENAALVSIDPLP
jgi:uncharacterized protein DUF4160